MWAVYALLILAALFFMWRNQRAGAATGLLALGRSRGRWVPKSETPTTFADVAGVDEAKDELREVVTFLSEPERYQRLGAKIPRGVLLIGPPGTGKTLLARAVAGEAKVPFLTVGGSEFSGILQGLGVARVRDLFQQAAQAAPCIVFIDELDALGRARTGFANNEDREQTLNQLLVEMDGFSDNEAVIVMAATNRPDALDAALLRPGRFDRHVVVDPPDRIGREAILKVHSKAVPLGPSVKLMDVAARTPGFTGADLANLVNEAALHAARHGKDTVEPVDFSASIDRVVAGLEKKSRLMSPEDKRRVAFHEVGHAIAAVLSGSTDVVHKISIIPRGFGALGFTMQLPANESHLLTKSEIITKLVGLLGGRAAEEVVFGEPSTGAQNDLQKATEIARSMVVDYGMSERVGPVSVSSKRTAVLLPDGGATVGRNVGDHLADLIDSEVQRIVHDALDSALALLKANRSQLDRIAARLIEVEVLEGDELAALLSDVRGASPTDASPDADR